MKAISLWQPFATLIVTGVKRFETRSWPIVHRGQLLIHASKKWGPDLGMLCLGKPFRAALEAAGIRFTANEADAKAGWGLPFGAIIGRVDVVGCYRTNVFDTVYEPPMSSTERTFGDFTAGRYAWELANPTRFATPIAYRGSQGIFDVPADALAGVV